MERGAHALFDLEKRHEFFPKSAGEASIAVRDDLLWKTVGTKNCVKELLGNVWGSVGCLPRTKVDHLGESVNEDSDGIKSTSRSRQLCDEIHGNG